MPRLHLVEFEDLPWFPAVIRDAMTDFLSFAGELTKGSYYDFVVPLRQAMGAIGERRLIDLCAGGGGPSRAIAGLLREQQYPVELLLTDLYPNVAQWERAQGSSETGVRFSREPVDATRVSPNLRGFRLLCNGFHHFRPEQARAILRDAVEQEQGIAVFEAIDPGAAGTIQPFVLMAMMLALTPFIRPFRWSRLLFTYVLPLAPLFLLSDGMVSWMRIYSEAGLRELTHSVSSSDPARKYEWSIGRARIPGGPLRGIYLIGTPRSEVLPAAA